MSPGLHASKNEVHVGIRSALNNIGSDFQLAKLAPSSFEKSFFGTSLSMIRILLYCHVHETLIRI